MGFFDNDLQKLHNEIRLIERGCNVAMTIGILGMLTSQTTEGRVFSGMLFFGGLAVRTGPAAIDVLNRFIDRK